MSSENLNPVIVPSLLYPALYGTNPQGKDYRCPKCQSTNRTRVTGIQYIPKEPFQKALDKWRDWVFQQGVTGRLKDPSTQKIEGYHFQCGWCGTEWFASRLVLNQILEEQIKRVANFTKETGKEFGALIIRTEDGLRLDMIDIGEDLSVELAPTHELGEDEELLGTWHSHPLSDTFSWWDVATFRRDNWEQISCVSGAKGTLTIMIKTPETIPLKPEEVKDWVKKCQKEDPELKDISKKYKFLLFRGTPGELKEISGDAPTMTLEELVGNVRGKKNIKTNF